MASIHILSHETIDKIAAGEVVERPASIVKELVENAIDAGADAITVEIKDGGISFIRVSDNGCGIEKSEIRKAFLRHATSKIQDADDLLRLHSLGFRGEALSSISAVSQTEMITKTKAELTGIRISMDGPEETDFEEIGAPDGTTIIVRNLFFNIPARRKFLKQPATEGSYVADLMEHLALANPQISFQFTQNNQVRFSTAGNGDLKQTVYKLYGKDMADSLIPIDRQTEGLRLSGFLGKPNCNRSNRNYEFYFLNGRFIKSALVARALEEGYKSYLMQHKYPFCVLMIDAEPQRVDVNVHPAKMEVRFTEEMRVYEFLAAAVKEVLDAHEMIPEIALVEEGKSAEKEKALEPFQRARGDLKEREAGATVPTPVQMGKEKTKTTSKDFFVDFGDDDEDGKHSEIVMLPAKTVGKMLKEEPDAASAETVEGTPETELEKSTAEVLEAVAKNVEGVSETVRKNAGRVREENAYLTNQVSQCIFANPGTQIGNQPDLGETEKWAAMNNNLPAAGEIRTTDETQLNLFKEKIISETARRKFRILGQVFDTYWIVVYEDKLLMIDQHAAHEKVKYERIMRSVRESEVLAQMLYPPLVLSLSGREQEILERYKGAFEKLGFELEYFGGNEITVRSAPAELFGSTIKEMFLEVLDELSVTGIGRAKSVEERIATMACKAAVKGNTHMTVQEMEVLLDELLTLDNPYFCPHGRPTIISFTKQELEKKFKRIV